MADPALNILTSEGNPGAGAEPALPDTTANPPGARWGVNGAHMARITLQKPVRIAILANQMLPSKA